MIKFDERGNITPSKIVELNLNDFETIFVQEVVNKEHRASIFQIYLDYLNQIQKLIGGINFQFINGSFTSQKPKPKDIDVVTFIDYRAYRSKAIEIETISHHWENIPEVDGYIVPFSEAGHPYYVKTQLIYDYWQDLYSHDRQDATGNLPLKGFIKINFNE